MHLTAELCKRGTYVDDLVLQKGETALLIAVVEAVREDPQSLEEINRAILCDVLDFTRRTYGHPQQIGALTIMSHCDHCQSFPLSDCT